MILTCKVTLKLISTLKNFWNFLDFSTFPNIVTFPLIPLATKLIFSSRNPLSNPLVFLLTQSPSLITILFNLPSLPTPLNSSLLSWYLLALGLNLIKIFSFNFFLQLKIKLLKLTIVKQETNAVKNQPNVGCAKKKMKPFHLVSECSKLAQKEYKRRHDKVATAVHWSILKTIFHIRNIGMSTKRKLLWKTKKLKYCEILTFMLTN